MALAIHLDDHARLLSEHDLLVLWARSGLRGLIDWVKIVYLLAELFSDQVCEPASFWGKQATSP